MARIAALVVPGKRAAWLAEGLAACGRALRGSPDEPMESAIFRGKEAACGLLRIGSDPLNPAPQPAGEENPLVLCGYVLPTGLAGAEESHGVAALADVAQAELERKLRRLDGVFAFVRWDARREQLDAVVDKLGMRPLFWTALPKGGYAVASEIKGLVAVLDQLAINWAAWEEQFAFGYQFGDHTVFDGILRLAPAERVTLTAESSVRRRYERPVDEVEPGGFRPAEYMEANHAAFESAMRRCERIIPPSAPRMLTLSGGFDSRRLFGWLIQNGVAFESFSVPGMRADGYEYEASIARRMCAAWGIPWHFIGAEQLGELDALCRVRDALTDFESDEHLYATFLTLGCKAAGRVNYDGLAGDVFVNGWFIHPQHVAPGGMALFRAEIRRQAAAMAWLPPVDPPLPVRIERYLSGLGDSPNAITRFYLRSRTRREVGLAPTGMQARFFESLYPYLDREVIAASMAVPCEVRASRTMQARLMAESMPALMAFPIARTAGPEEGDRVPAYGAWIRRGERAQLRSALKAVGRFGRALGLGGSARLRLYGLALAPLLPASQRGWQLYKAGFVRRFADFHEAAQSPAAYLAMTGAVLARPGTQAAPAGARGRRIRVATAVEKEK